MFVKSVDMSQWANDRDSEGLLPLLIRKLVASSEGVTKYHIPVLDSVSKPGVDGLVESSNEKHAFIPFGRSVWEFGRDRLRVTLFRMKKFFRIRHENRIHYAANITTLWMFGYSLSRLIRGRIEYKKEEYEKKLSQWEKNPEDTKPRLEPFNASVRNVFSDVENIARYEVPKLLSCYVDVMNYFFEAIGRVELVENKDLSLYLEFGVSKETHISMVLLGLSRSTISRLAELENEGGELILKDGLSEKECFDWLKNNVAEFEASKMLNMIQVNEVQNVLADYDD